MQQSQAGAPAPNPPINPLLLWIHCNRCFENYVLKKQRFFLLACHHLTCESCTTIGLGNAPNDAPSYLCPLCKKTVRGRQIGNTMPNNLKDLFHPEPWRDGLNHIQIHNFQKAHRDHFYKHIMKTEQKWRNMVDDIKTMHDHCRKLYLKLQHTKQDRKKLSHRAMQVKRQRQREKEQRARKSRASTQKTPPPLQPQAQSQSIHPGAKVDVNMRQHYASALSRNHSIQPTPFGPRTPGSVKRNNATGIVSFMQPSHHSFNL